MTDPMVSTAWLSERLDEPSVRILDASWFMPGSPRVPAAEYAAGHIPGAVRFDIDALSDQDSALPHMLPAPPDFAIAMRRLGIEPTTTLVVYDSEGLFSAPRAWWTFRAMGHATVFVLDGGLPRWIDDGHAVESGWREYPHGEFKAHPRADLIAGLDSVRDALEGDLGQVVDARPVGRFSGETPEPRPGLRRGHMPGAINVPWSTMVDKGTLLPAAWLKEVFDRAGVDLAKPVITTCGSGVSACVLALALARLGKEDVSVYDGSWSEWGGRPETPVVTGP